MFDKDTLNNLYRYSYGLTGEESTAYDLLQDGVESCLKQPEDMFTNLESYAKRVIRNQYVDQLRHQKRFPHKEYSEAEVQAIQPIDMGTNGLESMLIDEQQLDIIWQQLDHTEREILFYWAIEDMTAKEIAEVMEMRRGTVLSRIHRLRQKLKDTNDKSATASQRVS